MSQQCKAVTNVVIAGVGGQGSILASHLLAQTALKEGLDVKLAETFGAATRGGSVMAHVRMGKVCCPGAGTELRETGARMDRPCRPGVEDESEGRRPGRGHETGRARQKHLNPLIQDRIAGMSATGTGGGWGRRR